MKFKFYYAELDIDDVVLADYHYAACHLIQTYNSMKETGMSEPIQVHNCTNKYVVNKHFDVNGLVVFSGNTRTTVAKLLGYKKIPAIITEVDDPNVDYSHIDKTGWKEITEEESKTYYKHKVHIEYNLDINEVRFHTTDFHYDDFARNITNIEEAREQTKSMFDLCSQYFK